MAERGGKCGQEKFYTSVSFFPSGWLESIWEGKGSESHVLVSGFGWTLDLAGFVEHITFGHVSCLLCTVRFSFLILYLLCFPPFPLLYCVAFKVLYHGFFLSFVHDCIFVGRGEGEGDYTLGVVSCILISDHGRETIVFFLIPISLLLGHVLLL